MAGFSIERLAIPSSLEGEGGADFAATIEVRNAVERRGYGTEEVTYPAAEVLPHWHDPHSPKELWIARVDGAVVARGMHEMQVGEGSEVGWVGAAVHPDFQGRGIGRALADAVETYARELGQTRLLTYAVSPDATGPRITPPTGFGSLPAENREVRFLLARGYRLEQVERCSRFALPADARALAALGDAAQAAAGDDYRVHEWQGPTPRRWLDDLAHLLTRMSTDAPSAGLEEPEDLWTAERVAERDDRIDGPRFELTAAVEHVPTGRLVGFTKLDVPRDRTRAVGQDDTLVLREHRGHRLGMLLKIHNLQQLEREAPGHPSVLTWNAEENRYMLGVNEAVGFVPLGYEGAWRLDLTEPESV